jgi:glycosyltransferase involved in cell wall biosynthesis
LKILHFSALDGQTGAGIAAARIHEGLLARGVDSRFCVAYPVAGLKNAFTPNISLVGRGMRRVLRARDERMLRPISAGYDYVLSTGLCGFDIAEIVQKENPDIVQLHWIGGNSFRLSSLAGMRKPVVWRLSDQWPFCGVQHLEPDADTYTAPPARNGTRDISEQVRRKKAQIYKSIDQLVLVCPSRWLAGEAKRSALLGSRPIELIPTSCDTGIFFPRDRRMCRSVLGLPANAGILLVGATTMATRWKGGDLFADAVAKSCRGSTPADRPHIVSFGSEPLQAPELEGLVEITHFGPVRDRRLMAILYGAADVFCAPSRMENLANTVLESLACGTPVTAFAIGGMPDMIDHEVNGYLASPFDTADYGKGIGWGLAQRGRQQIREACVRKITGTFSLDQEIEGYLGIYRQLCSASSRVAALEPRPAFS